MELKEIVSSRDAILDMKVKAEEIAKAYPPPVNFVAVLDGRKMRTKPELMSAVAAELRFPAYFGHNWDALEECMRSLPDFVSAKFFIVVITGSAVFLDGENGALATFEDIVRGVAEFLKERYNVVLKVVRI